MPTQRPFFANLFGSLRARTSPTFQAKSSATVASLSPAAHGSTTSAIAAAARSLAASTDPSHAASNPQSIPTPNPAKATSTTTVSTTSPTATAHTTGSAFSPPFSSTSPGGHHFYHPRASGSTSPGPHNTNLSMSPPGASTPLSRGRQRRGSDSSNSSGGFMDAIGPSEKWYVGGRTAGGEERFYRLGLVTAAGTGAGAKRTTSLDRLSL